MVKIMLLIKNQRHSKYIHILTLNMKMSTWNIHDMQQILKHSDIKIHENLSSGIRADTDRQT
jgi:hypothetical protein